MGSVNLEEIGILSQKNETEGISDWGGEGARQWGESKLQ